MNKAWVIFHLKEAQEELNRTIIEIEKQDDYDFGEFVISMGHLYHHLNTAWNSKNASEAQVNNSTEDDFFTWRRFPKDIEIYLGR